MFGAHLFRIILTLGGFGSTAPAPVFGGGGGFGSPAPASGFGGGGTTFGSAAPATSFGE